MNNRYLPFELVNMIADYHDYVKYCKPLHKVIYSGVMSDIISMGEIMPEISPTIARQCWGNKEAIAEEEYEDYWENMDYNHYWEHLDNIDYLNEE